MTYGDLPLDAPEKPNKGTEGGACNRRACQAEPALWWNHGSYSWYCEECAIQIGQDVVNKRDWELRWQPKLGHPMFETREQMETRMESITFDSDMAGDVIHEKLQYTLGKGRLYFDPPLSRKDRSAARAFGQALAGTIVRPPVTYDHPPESRQVRRARERAEFKRLPRRA